MSMRSIATMGMLLTGLAMSPAPAVAAGDAAKGAVVFKRCVACHTVEPGKKAGMGPNLAGIVGRKAGMRTAEQYSTTVAAG